MTTTNDPSGYARDDEHAAYGETLAAAQAERFGGMKAGSAFFGWLSAMGMAVILTAIPLAAAGTAVGLGHPVPTDATEAAQKASQDVGTVGIPRRRHARGGSCSWPTTAAVTSPAGWPGSTASNRASRCGCGPWSWPVIAASSAAVAGSRYDVLGQLNSFPRVPVKQSDLTTAGVVALVLAAVTSLVGAVVGGSAGMRFHRRVDQVDVDAY